MVAFNLIPSNLRVPFVAVEIDSSRASPGSPLPFRALLMGQKLSSAPALANVLYKVTSADGVAALAGRGSMLHRQALAWFAFNRSTECWMGVLADNSAGVIASGTMTLAGTATAAGTISAYLGGNLVQVPVAVGDTAATIAGLLADAVGKHAAGTATATAVLAGATFTLGTTVFTAAAGVATPGAATFSIDTSDAATAASLAAQINAHAVASLLVRATSATNVATLRAIASGTEGNVIALASSAAALALSGTTLTAGNVGKNPDLPVHASVIGAVVTLRANNAGAVGNEFNVRMNYRTDGEKTPAGLSVTIGAMAGGATNPVLTQLIAALGDIQYNVVAHPFTDATSLTAIEAELSSRFGPLRMIDGHAFTAKDATYSAVSTLGAGRNSQQSTIIRTNDSPTPPVEYAAHVAAVAAYYLQIDPARPLQTLPLPYILAPIDRLDTLQERNLLLYSGISTTQVGGGGLVQIERLITTSQTNAAGSPDTAYLDVETMFIISFARANFRSRMATKYPRHKLGDDGVNYPAGEVIMTPSLGKAEAVSWFLDMSTSSPVVFDPSTLAQFKRDLTVVRNADQNRLDFLLPPDLINKLVVSAAQIQFIL